MGGLLPPGSRPFAITSHKVTPDEIAQTGDKYCLFVPDGVIRTVGSVPPSARVQRSDVLGLLDSSQGLKAKDPANVEDEDDCS